MPYRRRRVAPGRRVAKRKRYAYANRRRITRLFRGRVAIPRPLSSVVSRLSMNQPLPRVFRNRLRYYDEESLATNGVAVGTPVWVALRANSIYDPYQPAGGHQPMGYDQLRSVYRRYCVTGAKLTVKFCRATDANDQYNLPIIVGVVGTNNAVMTTTSTITASEQPGAVVKTCVPGQPCSITKTYSARRDFGVTDPLDEINLSATDDDPSRVWYWNIFAAIPVDTATSWPAVRIQYMIEFSVTWTEPIILPQS